MTESTKLPLAAVLESLNSLLRYALREGYKAGYSDGLSAGHPLGSHCDDPDAAWCDSETLQELEEGLESLTQRGRP